MKVSATELANESKKVLDRVIKRGEEAQVQRHGKTVARIRPQVGVTREELLKKLSRIDFSKEESQELKQAMDAASDVFGYAGRD